MTDIETPASVPALATLMATAQAINDEDPSVIESEIIRFSEPIAEVLFSMQKGDRELDKPTQKELEALYEEWADDGYPMPDDGYDEVQEGGELGVKAQAIATGTEDAPEAEPEPEE
jgi:hypothetical protein